MLIGLDLDQVLGEFVDPFLEFHNNTYGTRIRKSDIYTFDLERVFLASKKEMTRRLDEFYETQLFQGMSPIVGAQDGVKTLIERGHKLIVVTARPENIYETTISWLSSYFPKGIDDVILTSEYYSNGDNKYTKKEVCLERSIGRLVEDSLSTAVSCAEVCPVTLFSYPWNKTRVPAHLPIERVKSWSDVLKIIP